MGRFISKGNGRKVILRIGYTRIRKGSHFCLPNRKGRAFYFQRKRQKGHLADWLYKNPKGFPFLFGKMQGDRGYCRDRRPRRSAKQTHDYNATFRCSKRTVEDAGPYKIRNPRLRCNVSVWEIFGAHKPEAPSRRELPTESGEGERVTIKLVRI